MEPFVHRSREQRIVFGIGARTRVAEELDALSAERVLLITGGSASAIATHLVRAAGGRVVATFDEIAQHVPQDLASRAVAAADAAQADHLVSVGGGSATGLAKAVAVDLSLPFVAVPTTYSGSEMTPVWAVTGERKRTGSDDRALPATVIYDPDVTVDLPPRVSAASGMNALAQAVAALLHEPEDPIATMYARAAVRTLIEVLPEVVERPRDLGARSRALYGACLAAKALSATGTGLHHELAHIMGGRFGLVHADVHTVLLPHTTARMHRLAPAGFDRLTEAMGTQDPADALFELAARIGAPISLAEIGVSDDAYDIVLGDLHGGDLDPSEVRALLDDAHRGLAPGSPDG